MVQAARAATVSVPVVFTWVSDPVVSGIVKDLASPGSNTTGVSIRFFELAAKRLEFIRELLPAAKRVAVASGVFDTVLETAMEYVRPCSTQHGLEIFRIEARTTGWADAMRRCVKGGADAVLVMVPFAALGAVTMAEKVARFAIEQQLPAIFAETESVEVGGLMSYATDLRADLRRSVELVVRVLRGERPGDLPIDQAARFELAVNLKTAREIGVAIPRSILLRADRVIE